MFTQRHKGTKNTEEDKEEELSRQIAEYKAMQQETPAEVVLA